MWVALIYSGAVAVGVDTETHLVSEEHSKPSVYHLPDTRTGQDFEEMRSKERKQTYFKMPPNKRPNFIKLRVQYPFSTPWAQLLQSLKEIELKPVGSNGIGSGLLSDVLDKLGMGSEQKNNLNSITNNMLSVMRNARFLDTLEYICCRSGSRRRIFRAFDSFNSEQSISTVNDEDHDKPKSNDIASGCLDHKSLSVDELQDTLTLIKFNSETELVRVLVTVIGKGSIDDNAMICRPTDSDVKHFEKLLSGNEKPSTRLFSEISEPPRRDNYCQERKEKKQEHSKHLVSIYTEYTCNTLW